MSQPEIPDPMTGSTQTKPGPRFAYLKPCLNLLKQSLRLMVYLPLLLLIMLAIILGTPVGSKLGIMLANQLVPGLNADYQSGTLNKALILSRVSWKLDEISVDVSDLTLAWQPSCLLNWQVCIDDLNAASVTVTYLDTLPEQAENAHIEHSPRPDASEGNLSEANAKFDIPINILVKKATLNLLKVRANDMHINAETLSTRVIWNDSGLNVRRLSTTGLTVILPANDDDSHLSENELGQLALTELPEFYMPFPVHIKQFKADNSALFIGARQDKFSQISLAASLEGHHITLTALDFVHDYGKGSVTGELALKDNYPLTLVAHLSLDKIAELPELTAQSLDLSLSQDLSQLRLSAKAQGQTSFDLDGQINLTSRDFDYSLELTQAQWQWPLNLPQYSGHIDALSSKGNLKGQHLSMTGTLTAGQQPEITFSTALTQADKVLTLSALNVSSPAGQLEAKGTLNYHQGLSWQGDINAQALQLQHFIAALPAFSGKDMLYSSNISGQLYTQGQVSTDKWQFALSNANLTGSLNGYPLSVTGDISLDSDWHLVASQLDANALGANLSIHGKLEESWDVNAELKVADVSQWLPNSLGSIKATANISGKQDNPLLSLQAELNAFSAKGMSLDYTQLTGHYSPFSNHKFALKLRNNQLNWKKYRLTDLSVSAKGDLNQQSVELSSGGALVINSQLSSQYDALTAKFKAQLQALTLESKLGLWRIDNPSELVWDNNQGTGSLSPVCLVHPQSSLCLVAPIKLGKEGKINLNARGNPGRLFAAILPKKIRWDGDAVLTSQIQWREGQRPTAAANFALMPGNITLIRDKNNQISLDYQQLLMSLTLDEQQFKSQISFNSEGIAKWESLLTIANDQDRRLLGSINIESLNLQPFGEFFPQIATLEGTIATQLQIAGTLGEPDISGNIKLSDGALSMTSNPTLFDKLYLNLALAGQRGELNGHWNMGKGEAKVAGTLAWPQGQFSGDMDISGETLAVIQPPLAILDVSPKVNLTFNKHKLTIKGDIAVPSGQIKIVQLAQGGVAVSDDIVFKDSISDQEVKTSPYGIVADLNIDVGNELTIDGLGLTGKLSGKLILKQKAFKPPLLYGDIKVKRGNYRFMGQNLKISTGEVQFVGSPENPNLNIQAIRKIKDEDLSAGVRITGTPMRPVVTLFSNPAKEQAEILSYILKGTGFSSTNNQQNNALMMSAALSLSSQYDGGAINNIGNTASGLIEKFGFSNVQLDANDEGRVAVSGYIGEDLMVKYGMGVFNPGYEMTVRYYLLSQLYLESVSSTLSQSLDIYYSFDVD